MHEIFSLWFFSPQISASPNFCFPGEKRQRARTHARLGCHLTRVCFLTDFMQVRTDERIEASADDLPTMPSPQTAVNLHTAGLEALAAAGFDEDDDSEGDGGCIDPDDADDSDDRNCSPGTNFRESRCVPSASRGDLEVDMDDKYSTSNFSGEMGAAAEAAEKLCDFQALNRVSPEHAPAPAPAREELRPSGQAVSVGQVVSEAHELLRQLTEVRASDLPAAEKMARILDLPFPICVFGTLRVHHHNNWFMGLPCSDSASRFTMEHLVRDQMMQSASVAHRNATVGSALPESRPRYSLWCPASVADLSCAGLKVVHERESHLMSEVFYFSRDQFKAAIGAIDGLESFHLPELCRAPHARETSLGSESGYVRSLFWVSLLPLDSFNKISHDLGKARKWSFTTTAASSSFPRVPAWVYSSVLVNTQLLNNRGFPTASPTIIWAPHKAPEKRGENCFTRKDDDGRNRSANASERSTPLPSPRRQFCPVDTCTL